MSDTPNIETRARELGWTDRETFKGDPERWVDAETFVKRGEEMLPLVKATNKRLEHQIGDLTNQLSEAQQAIKESQESMAALIAHQSEATLEAVRASKANLRARIREARQAEDWTALDALEEQMDDVRDAEKEAEGKVAKAKAPPPPPPAPAAPRLDPEFVAWQAENPWFGTDKRRTAYAVTEAQLLRADPANRGLVGRAFYEEAARLADERLSPPPTRHSKVDTGSSSGPAVRGGSEGTYESLPKEAKEACERQSKLLVGPNRAFKDMAAWQKHYAKQYFAQE